MKHLVHGSCLSAVTLKHVLAAYNGKPSNTCAQRRHLVHGSCLSAVTLKHVLAAYNDMASHQIHVLKEDIWTLNCNLYFKGCCKTREEVEGNGSKCTKGLSVPFSAKFLRDLNWSTICASIVLFKQMTSAIHNVKERIPLQAHFTFSSNCNF